MSGVSPEEAAVPPPVEGSRLRQAVPWALAAILLAAFGIALWGRLHPPAEEPRRVIRYAMMLPNAPRITEVRLSRDGARLAYKGLLGQIYIRPMDQLEARPLAGTEGADNFFFSPDGQWLGFLLGGKLCKISVAGGASVPLTDVAGGPYRILWLPDDNIVFTKEGALMRVPASGGKPEVVTAPDERRRGEGYSAQQVLPDGRSLLFTKAFGADENEPLSILDLQSGRKKVLVDTANWAGYAPTGRGKGHVIYRAGESLFAAAFDPTRLQMTGSPVPVVEAVGKWQGNVLAAFSDSGVLIYVPATVDPEEQRTLVWVDQNGSVQPMRVPRHGYVSPRLSPDGERVAIQIQGSMGGGGQIGVIDLARGTFTQVTFQAHNVRPVWTTDGKRLTYRSNGYGGTGIFTVPADGSGPPVLLTTENKLGIAHSWSPDGKLLIGTENGSRGFWLYSARPEGSGGEVKSLLDSPTLKREAMISPDGHWLAYASNETGRYQIYVQSFPGMGERTTISAEGGESPRWKRDGRELFYRNGDTMMATEIRTSPAFHAGVPRKLFEGRYGTGYDVSPDGKRFLMIKPGPETPPQNTELHVVVNWFEEVRRLSPGTR